MSATKKMYEMTERLKRDLTPCCCIGPQNGEPVCPCKMRKVTIENGRYIIKMDLGEVRDNKKALERRWLDEH